MLHVSAPEKRRVEPGALLDLVVIGKTADEDVNDLQLGVVDIDRFFFFSLSLIPLIADGPHHYHPACGH